MLTVEGKYKDGKVVLSELHPEFDDSRVIVMFVEPRVIHLADKGIDREQAASLRGRLGAIADDWDAPEMDVYDAD